jgi:leucyl-tRNA synthetase
MTVLANEQVIDGKRLALGRAGRAAQALQWFLKITDFAEELLEGLGALDQWPEKVRLMQENWIGKSQGMRSPSTVERRGLRSTPPGPTRSSAPASSPSRPTIRWRRRWR